MKSQAVDAPRSTLFTAGRQNMTSEKDSNKPLTWDDIEKLDPNDPRRKDFEEKVNKASSKGFSLTNSNTLKIFNSVFPPSAIKAYQGIVIPEVMKQWSGLLQPNSPFLKSFQNTEKLSRLLSGFDNFSSILKDVEKSFNQFEELRNQIALLQGTNNALKDKIKDIRAYMSERDSIINSENPYQALQLIESTQGKEHTEHLFNSYIAPTLKDPSEEAKLRKRLKKLEEEKEQTLKLITEKDKETQQLALKLEKQIEAETARKEVFKKAASKSAQSKRTTWEGNLTEFLRSDYYSARDTDIHNVQNFRTFMLKEKSIDISYTEQTIARHLRDFIKNKSKS